MGARAQYEFPLFATATIHVLTAGTDRRTVLLRALVVGGVLLTSVLTALRIWNADDHDVMTAPRIPRQAGNSPG